MRFSVIVLGGFWAAQALAMPLGVCIEPLVDQANGTLTTDNRNATVSTNMVSSRGRYLNAHFRRRGRGRYQTYKTDAVECIYRRGRGGYQTYKNGVIDGAEESGPLQERASLAEAGRGRYQTAKPEDGDNREEASA